VQGVLDGCGDRRHLFHAEEYQCELANRFSTWNEVTGLTTAA